MQEQGGSAAAACDVDSFSLDVLAWKRPSAAYWRGLVAPLQSEVSALREELQESNDGDPELVSQGACMSSRAFIAALIGWLYTQRWCGRG